MNEQVVLVTGASRGLGRSVARAFHRAGARVVVSATSAEGLADVARELGALAIPADLARPAEIDRLFAAVDAAYGRLDVLVNNAGVTLTGPLEGQSADDLRRLVDVNLRAPLLCSRAAFSIMRREGRGTVVNVSSGAASRPMVLLAAYSSVKAALSALTVSLRQEFVDAGLRMFVVEPGAVDTEIVSHHTPEFEARHHGAIRRMPPEVVAEVILRLCSVTDACHPARVVVDHLPG